MPESAGEPAKATDYPTPGTRLLGTVGTGPIRGIKQASNGACYVVSGSEVYSVNTTSWVGTSLGSITAVLRTPVSMADNTLDLVIVDGTANGWVVNLAANTMSPIVDATGMFAGADRVDYLDTYLLFNKPNTPQFYISEPLAVTFDSLDFANKGGYTDKVMTLIVAKIEVWLIGERTSEVWYNAGATDIAAGSFPFARVQSVFVDHGTCAKYSVAGYDNGVFWLTRDRQGQGFVVHGAGYQTKRVSTYAIEAEIATYARLDDAIGFCYQLGGHTFYVLTFPHADKTWVHDITTGLWHEWVWLDTNGNEHRHRANCFSPVGSTLVVGDWQNGNLYALDSSVHTDNGQPIKRLRSFPHILKDGDRLFYSKFLADLETGTSTAVAPGEVVRLSASFSAVDGTALEAYTSEIGGGWTVVDGADAGQIQDNRLIGTGGDALYQSAAVIVAPDYSLRFNVVPQSYSSVVADTSMYVIGRASGSGAGYRAQVSADGTEYTLTLTVEPAGTPAATVAMGTLASGSYTVWLRLLGPAIIAQVQRSQDGRLLRTDGTWQTAIGTIAAQFTDTTYTAPGAIMIGGTWPAPVPVTPAGITATLGTAPPTDPNFPTGYSTASSVIAFDFARNWSYARATGSGIAGVSITDLSTMAVVKTATLDQMFAGTAFGPTPGTSYGQTLTDVSASLNSDLYLLTGADVFHKHFVRVDPLTMKVTGEFYGPGVPGVAGAAGILGVVNKTATHTIVGYTTPSADGKALIYDGTGMAFIGFGPEPGIGGTNSRLLIAGGQNGDGSCDFWLLACDEATNSGDIEIWRIRISDALVMTPTLTGTANVAAIIPLATGLFIAQADYDAANDCLLLQLTNSTVPAGPPIWIASVEFGGAINWSIGSFPDIGIAAGKGQSLLSGDTLMFGGGTALTLIDTETGATTFTGSSGSGGSFYRVYDASRQSYWYFSLGAGFTRIDFHEAVIPPTLGMDDVVATTEAGLDSNLISLRWSDDRAHSWSNPVSRNIGAVGEYRTSLVWQRLGMARDRCFELSWSVPMPTALQGAWVTVTSADS